MNGPAIRRAAPEEFEAVRDFYCRLIDDMKDMPYRITAGKPTA